MSAKPVRRSKEASARRWERALHEPEQNDSGVSPLREPPHRLRCVDCDNLYGGSPQPSIDRRWWFGYCAYCRQGVMLVPDGE